MRRVAVRRGEVRPIKALNQSVLRLNSDLCRNLAGCLVSIAVEPGLHLRHPTYAQAANHVAAQHRVGTEPRLVIDEIGFRSVIS